MVAHENFRARLVVQDWLCGRGVGRRRDNDLPAITMTAQQSAAPATGCFGTGPNTAAAPTPPPNPNAAATAADHKDMMEQLGITALRPGPSGNESAPNHANYDEALANPYPKLPEVLTLKNGRKVTSAADVVERSGGRRSSRSSIARCSAASRRTCRRSRGSSTAPRTSRSAGEPVVGKELIGQVDNSSYPEITVDIQMTRRHAGRRDEAGAGDDDVRRAIRDAAGARHSPAGRRAASAPAAVHRPNPAMPADPPATEQLIADGWGYATISPNSIQADNGAGLTAGIIGLVNKGQPRKPDDWGSLRAWAWGASRGLDYLETDKAVDAKKVGIEGVSRYGKAALVTMAFDQRFAVVLVGSSGEGGAKLHRRNFGEAVENLTGSGEYHWMAGNFLKYGTAESTFGSKNAGDIPVDAHQLIALCAPRLTFISYGVPERGDAKWLDQQGSYMAAVAAQPVFRLLGAKDLGVSDDYTKEKMPAVNVSLLDGQLAWRQHDGGHTDGPNWKYFIPWADKFLKHTPAASGSDSAVVRRRATRVGVRLAIVLACGAVAVASPSRPYAQTPAQAVPAPAATRWRLPIGPRRAPTRTR